MPILDDFDTQIQCEEVYDFQPTSEDYKPYDDEDDFIEDTGEHDVILDDEDEDHFGLSLMNSDGITAEGYNYLHELDKNGYFV